MSRLLQQSRPDSAAARPSGRPASGAALPPYEPPAHPMNEENKGKLTRMAGSQNDTDRRKYEKHLAVAVLHLGKSVGNINEMVTQRRKELAVYVNKHGAQDREDERSNMQAMEQYLAELDQEVGRLTNESEVALRRILDCRAELAGTPKVLGAVLTELAKQQPRPEPKPKKEKRDPRRRRNNNEDEGEEDEQDAEDQEMEAVEDVPPLVGVAETLKAARKADVEEYKALSAYERYATHNDYISFKSHWHIGLHGDDIPLPDASAWFDENGLPVKAAAASANDDDDLVVAREVIDLKCPLSLQVFREPFSNHKCKHTFEKSAITEFIGNNGGLAKCPVCSQDLRLSDFYLDEIILRRVKRAERAAREDVAATSDIEDEAIDSSIVLDRSNNIKKERNQSRRPVEDVDED